MSDNTLTLRKTPFLFIRLLVIVEFFVGFLPIFVITFFPVQAEYNQTSLASSISYPVLLIIVLTTLQIMIIAFSFFSWYLPVYQVDRRRVAYKRGGAVEFQELIRIPAISCISPHQRWLGRRFDYGDVQLYSNSEVGVVTIRDIPDPVTLAIQLEERIANYWDPAHPLEPQPLSELLAAGESHSVEFKSSLLWDYRQEQMNKSLSDPILKSVAAFLNSAGGTLLIGVGDDGMLLGLEPDFSVLKKPNPDGFELIFNNAFNRAIGPEFRSFVHLSFPEIEGKMICRVEVQPATRPVYFQHPDREEFYIRAGNLNQPLPVSKATVYIRDRFQL